MVDNLAEVDTGLAVAGNFVVADSHGFVDSLEVVDIPADIHLAEEADNHPAVAGTGSVRKEGLDFVQDHDNLAEVDSV